MTAREILEEAIGTLDSQTWRKGTGRGESTALALWFSKKVLVDPKPGWGVSPGSLPFAVVYTMPFRMGMRGWQYGVSVRIRGKYRTFGKSI